MSGLSGSTREEGANGDKVVVSLTTISPRLGKVTAVLRSILDQSVKPDKVLLAVSEEAKRLDEGIRVRQFSPELLEMVETGQVDIVFVRNDGPYRKLLPALARYRGSGALIATADDDISYPTDWLKGLLQTHQKKGCVAAYRCRAMRVIGDSFAPYKLWKNLPADGDVYGDLLPDMRPLFTLPVGMQGVLYHTSFFRNMKLMEKLRAVAAFQDDLAFKAMMLVEGIPTARVSDTLDWEGPGPFRELRSEGGALFDSNRRGNDDAWSDIMDVLAAEVGFSLAGVLSR